MQYASQIFSSTRDKKKQQTNEFCWKISDIPVFSQKLRWAYFVYFYFMYACFQLILAFKKILSLKYEWNLFLELLLLLFHFIHSFYFQIEDTSSASGWKQDKRAEEKENWRKQIGTKHSNRLFKSLEVLLCGNPTKIKCKFFKCNRHW